MTTVQEVESKEYKPGQLRGKKPVHIEGVNLTGQDAIWAGIRKLKVFTREELVFFLSTKKYAGVNEKTVESYIKRLTNGGYLAIKSKARKGITKGSLFYTYELTKDVGVDAPRLTKDGKPSKQGRGNEALWRSMRILKQFSCMDLLATSQTENLQIRLSTVQAYVQHLSKAGYVKCIQPRKVGKTISPAVYRFINFTGPKPPMVQSTKHIYDPNLNEVVWVEELNHE